MKDQIKTLTNKILKTKTTGQLSNYQKAKGIETYLKKNYRYSLNVKPPRGHINPILYFLFQSKTGFCEHYATAMTLMLRSAGIPARIATGFLGGELNTYGGYLIVRQRNAHTWVEAFINDSWERFDPTPLIMTQPPSKLSLYIDMLELMWDRYVIAFSLSDQKEIVRAVSMPFIMPGALDFKFKRKAQFIIGALVILIIAGTFFLLRNMQHKRYGFITVQYLKLREILRRRGVTIKPSSTTSEIEREAAHLGMNQSILEAIKLYEECRFGKREMGGEERARYKMLIKEIKRQLK